MRSDQQKLQSHPNFEEKQFEQVCPFYGLAYENKMLTTGEKAWVPQSSGPALLCVIFNDDDDLVEKL